MNRLNQVFLAIVFIVVFLACEQKVKIASLPSPITNNAVCGAEIDGKKFVYSFGGLGAGKTHSDISLRSFKLDVSANVCTEIDALPDTMPKIAAAASLVNGKIYIIGGYYVFQDGHEKSSAKVHVFDPVTNKYLEDAMDIPTPIDDQVQAVWRDSLIYVATGWSDSLNVGMVQVFDPATNQWQYGTPLPDEYSYKVFGASGSIIGDRIYFAGGAGNRQNKNFPLQSHLRVGYINPENPLDITWETLEMANSGIYRSGAIVVDNQPAWIGGANMSYNYNGISYTKQAVEPQAQILVYDVERKYLKKLDMKSPSIMDMRGVAQFDDFIMIVGGIGSKQVVSDKVYSIEIQ